MATRNQNTAGEIKAERRGGHRKGAGRKPSTIKGVTKQLRGTGRGDLAQLILSKIDAHSKWIALSNSKDERIRFETLKYLTDRAYGKPKQALDVEHSGEVEVKRVVVDL